MCFVLVSFLHFFLLLLLTMVLIVFVSCSQMRSSGVLFCRQQQQRILVAFSHDLISASASSSFVSSPFDCQLAVIIIICAIITFSMQPFFPFHSHQPIVFMRFHSSSHPPAVTFLLFIAKFRCAHNALLPACLLQQCVSRMQPRSVSPSSASDHSLWSCCSCQRRFRP